MRDENASFTSQQPTPTAGRFSRGGRLQQEQDNWTINRGPSAGARRFQQVWRCIWEAGGQQEDFEEDTHVSLFEEIPIFLVRLLDCLQDRERRLQGPEGREGIRQDAQRSGTKTRTTKIKR